MSKPIAAMVVLGKLAKAGKLGVLLEAEIAPNQQSRFERRYKAATGQNVSPSFPKYYQSQPNKWGSELRGYLNDPAMAVVLDALGVHVESRRKGYRANGYRYRFSHNKLWWKLVENYGLRLGPN